MIIDFKKIYGKRIHIDFKKIYGKTIHYNNDDNDDDDDDDASWGDKTPPL